MGGWERACVGEDRKGRVCPRAGTCGSQITPQGPEPSECPEGVPGRRGIIGTWHRVRDGLSVQVQGTLICSRTNSVRRRDVRFPGAHELAGRKGAMSGTPEIRAACGHGAAQNRAQGDVSPRAAGLGSHSGHQGGSGPCFTGHFFLSCPASTFSMSRVSSPRPQHSSLYFREEMWPFASRCGCGGRD